LRALSCCRSPPSLQTEIPIAAWLAPALLIRFARTQRAALGLLVLTLVSVAAMTIASRDIVEWPTVLLTGGTFGLAYALPYVADRLLATRLGGLARTLVFPAAESRGVAQRARRVVRALRTSDQLTSPFSES